MSELTPTPGPWMVGRTPRSGYNAFPYPVFCTDGTGRWLAVVDTEANARLIAAAPALLEAAKAALDALDAAGAFDPDDAPETAYRLLRAAIALAEGPTWDERQDRAEARARLAGEAAQ